MVKIRVVYRERGEKLPAVYHVKSKKVIPKINFRKKTIKFFCLQRAIISLLLEKKQKKGYNIFDIAAISKT